MRFSIRTCRLFAVKRLSRNNAVQVLKPAGSRVHSATSHRPPPARRKLRQERLRAALNSQVTGLFPAPTLASVSPDPAIYGGGQNVNVTIYGTNFLAGAAVQLIRVGDPTPNPVNGLTLIDPQTLAGQINVFQTPPALYDVRLINADGQQVTLVAGLLVK